MCKEHARILHQVEHINWHLEGCTRHRPCMGRMPDSCTKKVLAPSNASCISSSALTCNRPSAVVRESLCTNHFTSYSIIHLQSIISTPWTLLVDNEKDLSCQANLKNSSERLIKSIVDLRKKIYIVQEKLDCEIKVSGSCAT